MEVVRISSDICHFQYGPFAHSIAVGCAHAGRGYLRNMLLPVLLRHTSCGFEQYWISGGFLGGKMVMRR